MAAPPLSGGPARTPAGYRGAAWPHVISAVSQPGQHVTPAIGQVGDDPAGSDGQQVHQAGGALPGQVDTQPSYTQ